MLHKTTRELWLDTVSVKPFISTSAIGGRSTESIWKNTLRAYHSGFGKTSRSFTNLDAEADHLARGFLGSSDYLKQVVTKGSWNENLKKTRDVSQKDVGDYTEKMQLLRKEIAALRSENDHLKGHNRQLVSVLTNKEKELRELAQPVQSNKLIQNFGERKGDALRTIRALQQKVYRLEEQLRGKENELNQLQSDLKYTRTEELRVQLEMTFSEVARLQGLCRRHAIEEVKQTRSSARRQPPSISRKRGSKHEKMTYQRVKSLEQSVQQLDTVRQELLKRNRVLANKLRQVAESRGLEAPEFTGASDDKQPTEPQASLSSSRKQGTLVATLVECEVPSSMQRERATVELVQETDAMEELVESRARIATLEEQLAHVNEDKEYYKLKLDATKNLLEAAQRKLARLGHRALNPTTDSSRTSIVDRSGAISAEDFSHISSEYSTHSDGSKQGRNAAKEVLQAAIQGHLSRQIRKKSTDDLSDAQERSASSSKSVKATTPKGGLRYSPSERKPRGRSSQLESKQASRTSSVVSLEQVVSEEYTMTPFDSTASNDSAKELHINESTRPPSPDVYSEESDFT